MGKYRIEIKKSAAKEIKHLPSQDIRKILVTIEALSENPRPQGCIKLSGDEKYRVRCGMYRIVYAILDNVLLVTVVRVGHRKNVYQKR